MKLHGAFAEDEFKFVQVSVTECTGPECASPSEKKALWDSGLKARLSWPPIMPNFDRMRTGYGKRNEDLYRYLRRDETLLVDVFMRAQIAKANDRWSGLNLNVKNRSMNMSWS